MEPSRGAIGQKGEEEAVEGSFDLRGTDSCGETEEIRMSNIWEKTRYRHIKFRLQEIELRWWCVVVLCGPYMAP